MRTLDGHVGIVTGGTFGVGRGIASALAQYGARVFVTGRSAHDDIENDQSNRLRTLHIAVAGSSRFQIATNTRQAEVIPSKALQRESEA